MLKEKVFKAHIEHFVVTLMFFFFGHVRWSMTLLYLHTENSCNKWRKRRTHVAFVAKAQNNCHDAWMTDCFNFRTCPRSQASLVGFGNSRFTGSTPLCCRCYSSLNSPISAAFVAIIPLRSREPRGELERDRDGRWRQSFEYSERRKWRVAGQRAQTSYRKKT